MLWHDLGLDTLNNLVQTRRVTLTDGIQFANVRYAPRIASPRDANLAGAGPYADVDDEITLDILGNTPGETARNLRRLLAWFVQAGAWAAGENVQPVQLRGRLACGRQDVTCLVLGLVGEADSMRLDPEPTIAAGDSAWVLRDVSIRFRRRGRWLESLRQTFTTNALNGTNPTITSMSLDTPPPGITSPLLFLVFREDANHAATSGVLALSSTAAALFLSDTALMTATGYTLFNDAANNPLQGTDVLRYTPTTTAPARSGPATLNTTFKTRRITCVLAARCQTADSAWVIRALIREIATGITIGTSAPFVFSQPATALVPELLILPPVSFACNTSTGFGTLELAFEITAISTSAGVLDLSYFLTVADDTPATSILRLTPPSATLSGLFVQNRELGNALVSMAGYSTIAGTIAFENPSGIIWSGDAAIESEGSTLAATWLQTNGAQWRLPGAASIRFYVARRNASLIPDLSL